jgi:hypothetical protein
VPLNQSKNIEGSQLNMSDTSLLPNDCLSTPSLKAQNESTLIALPTIVTRVSVNCPGYPTLPYKTIMVKKKTRCRASTSHRAGVVLITDDNKVNRKIIGRMLQFYDVESVEAVNGKEAVDIIRRAKM